MTVVEQSTEASAAAARGARRLRIALIGGFGIGNFGNDASLEAALSFLRQERPDADITCICTKPDRVEAAFKVEVLPTVKRPKGAWRWIDTALLRQPSLLANWVYALKTLREFDLILFPGTGVFDDFLDTPLGWPSRLLRWCGAARMRGVRIAFVSVGAGPILNPISRVMMRTAAAMAQYRSYRDPESKAYMLGLGVRDESSDILPDIAFLLPKPELSAAAVGDKLTIGVGVMNYSGWRKSEAVYEDYLAKHAALIDWIEAQGYGMRILVGQTSDWRAVQDIEQRLGRSLAASYPESMNSIHDVMRAAAATDLVVASRYHVQVAALKMGKPVISLTYAPKNDELLAAGGLEGFSQDIHAIDMERLTEQIRLMSGDRARYASIVHERVTAMEQRLRDAMARLDLAG